jgi:hypothetical protein
MPTRIQPDLLLGPYRSPDWRHNQAEKVNADGRLASRNLYDKPTRKLAAFYQGLRGCRTDFDYDRLYRRMPREFAAYKLFKEGRGGVRETVAGMVLAREPAANIAECVGSKPDTIRFFEDAYFDCRSRLGQCDFILNQVIEINREPRNKAELLFKAMKFYGYVAGPLALEVFRFYVGPPIRWQHIGEVLEYIELRARALMQFEAVGPNGQMSREATRGLVNLFEWNREFRGRFGDEDSCRTPGEFQLERMTRNMMYAYGLGAV